MDRYSLLWFLLGFLWCAGMVFGLALAKAAARGDRMGGYKDGPLEGQ